MAFKDDDVAAVRAASDIVAIISEHVGLKRVGRRWTGLCPFHGEKSPSFSVNAEQGLYYCFGCSARGDAISFVREIEHVDFVTAVEKLAARANIPLRHSDDRASGDRKRRMQLVDIMGKAVDFYHERLLNSPDAAAARAYLRNRGYDGKTVRAFKIGWAPDDWDQLAKFLKAPSDILEDVGLGFTNRRGKQQDAFRARVMFPIFDANNVPVALGGRVLGQASEGQPKYKNSPETKLYSKRRTLYGLNWAKDSAVREGEIVVCEGYTDVIGFVASGVTQAVATCGTALGEEHVRLMKSYANRVVLAYDADAAGQSAAERFYEWERKFEIDLFVAALPKGADPADVARKDPEALKLAVKNAKPYLEFRLDRVLLAADLRAPETRARAAQRAIGLVAEHPNPLVRDEYVMKVADALRFDADQVRQQLVAQLKKPANQKVQASSAGSRWSAGPATVSRSESPQTTARPGSAQSSRSRGSNEPPPPDDSHFAASELDGSHSPSGRPRQQNVEPSAPTPMRGRTTTSTAVSASAEREALLYATQHATEVAELLEGLLPSLASTLGEDANGLAMLAKVLFVDDVFLAAFQTLLGAPTLSEALDAASPEVGELLNRLAVEDETLPPETSVSQQVADIFAMLFWTATQRAAKQMRIKSSETGETFDLGEVKSAAEHLLDGTTRVVAMRRLIPWLVAMVEDE